MATGPSTSRRFRSLVVAALALIGGALIAWMLIGKKETKKPVDIEAALEANTRGVGCMEQFKYTEALAAFEEAVTLAPDWVPARINLAIALLNEAGKITPNTEELIKVRKDLFGRAIELYKEIIRKETDKRWLTYAHYGLGVIYLTLGDGDSARPYLRKATELDPSDPQAVFRLGLSLPPDEVKEAADCYRKAKDLDPYFGSASYAYFTNPHVRSEVSRETITRMVEEHKKMDSAELFNASKDRYSELGRYGEVIGRPPSETSARPEPLPGFLPPENFKVQLAPGTIWATEADLGKDETGELRRLVRQRFGGTLVLLDYDRDGKIDVFLVGAVVRKGQLGNVLFRNEGEGVFTDVTEKVGLAGSPAALGCAVADFDNNDFPDLFLTGVGEQRLYRNIKGTFEDVTAKAGLDQLKGVCLAAAFVDLDQDGDLDLVVSVCKKDVAEAVKILKEGQGGDRGELVLYTNNGHAYPRLLTTDPPPLEPKFMKHDDPVFQSFGPTCGIVVSDVDLDGDLDLIILPVQGQPELILNDRLLRFRRAALAVAGTGPWSGGVVLDVDQDEQSDLLLLDAKDGPSVLMHEEVRGNANADRLFRSLRVASPRLLQAQVIDLDLDGKQDILALGADSVPVLLHNENNKLVHLAGGVGGETVWGKDVLAIAAADIDGDGRPDLVGWSQKKGLLVLTQRQNSRHGLQLELTGHRRVDVQGGGDIVRCNADGFGTQVIVQAGSHWSRMEYGTLSSGLGQSRVPLTLGLGKHTQAQVVRLRWPDNCWQAEFNIPAGKGHRIEETNRKQTSCPVLFAWNGQRFAFVTDFLGGGTLGEMLSDGSHRQPRPEESVKIEAHQLVPRNGEFVLKIAEPMDEVTYLDRLQLIVLDHPAGASVYPDERMATAGPQPSQDLLSFTDRIQPIKATNHRGKDVTAKLREWDRDAVDQFAWRSWIGFAEDHWVELEFGDRLKDVSEKDRLVLFLAGWTEYAYPESIWAANQAGLAMQAPVLEQKSKEGRWQPVAEIGFPAGMPRMMTFDLTGKLAGNRGLLRIRTNLQVFWDQLYLAKVVERVPAGRAGEQRTFRVTPLEVSRATLSARGMMQEFSPDGKLPTIYDHDRLAPMPVNRLSGRLTRYGDVTELLHEADDCFVLIGPGDESEVRFDARNLPSLKEGWKRSYVLRTWGYCKDTAPFTATGETIDPLPFRAMSSYPYGAKGRYPDTPKHRDYLRRYQTRSVGQVGK